MAERGERPLSLFDITCIGVNAIVGSSIFLFPGRLAGMLGPASILSFGLSGLLLGCVALCFAEASADFDGHGGPYLYARTAFGNTTGYAIGWLCWLAEVLSLSAVADGIAVYLGFFDPKWASPVVVKSAAVGVIVLMGAINYRGVKLGAWTSNFFTVAKLVPLLVFVACGLPQVKAANLAPFAPKGWQPMGAACLLTFFAYSGFEVVPVPAGEVGQAKSKVPIATVLSMGFSALLYMAIQGVAVGVHPGLSGSERPLADAAAVALGSWGASFIVIGAVISTAGFCAGCALGGPRYLVALADQGDWPAAFAAPHPRYRTPALAIAVTAGLSVALALLLDFNKLVDITVVVVCAQYLSTCAAIPVMRRRFKRTEGFRLPGGPVLPLIGFASTLWLGSQASRDELLWCAGMLASGFVIRWGLKRARFIAKLGPALVALLLAGGAARAEDLGEAAAKLVSDKELGADIAAVAAEPHVAGTRADLKLADYLEKRFLEYGLDVQTARYDVLLSYPEETTVNLLKPAPAFLIEPEGDLLTPEQRRGLEGEDLIPWNAYAASGEVKEAVVYANYGRPEDYKALDAMGISIKGKIVLARYSEGYRGGKTLEAQKRGAAAILFYSDPADDGWAQGDPMPKGPWGTEDHFQRGSNVYDFMVPGDPLTPGWASVEGARRIKPEESAILPKLPSAPLSYRAASRILAVLEGPAVPKGWQGALPFTYHVGPGGLVHMRVKNRNEVRPIVNVIAKLRGSEEPEKLVFISGHHDAWTRGAVDDGIGTAITLELARVFGELARRGVRPKRTLVFASWDAEEYTLTGSTEWGEEHEQELTENAAALLNVDAYRWGREFTAIGVPSLRRLVLESLARVPDPITGKPIAAPEVGILGSGSDYTVFLNRLGVPAVETMFTGNAGVYHSIYDDASWVSRVDPGWKYVGALARVNAHMAARLASDERLPFEYSAYAREVGSYLGEIARLAPSLDLAASTQAAKAWEDAALSFESTGTAKSDPARARCADNALLQTERGLLEPGGIPGRPWFRHLIYAPRPSYDAMTLPGLREAVEAGDLTRASQQARILEAALGRAVSAQLKAAECYRR